jgi:eukaryotic-like serine/threonine-protein kinase
MEYVDGVDLSKVLRRSGGLPLERCLLIAIQICRGLEAAHKAGIIHRDLKPSNVMLVRDREDEELVKVLDFGVAKFLRQDQGEAVELTMADATVGTPRYMAPEQIESGKGIDFRVDIYAVGGLIYAMLSGGRAPFESESIHELWRRKTSEEPPSISKVRSDLPDSLTRLTMRCLARDPAKRPQSIIAMRAPSETSRVDAIGAETNSPATSPTNPTRSMLLAAAAGIVLLGGALTWWATGDAAPGASELKPVAAPAPVASVPPAPAPAPAAPAPAPTASVPDPAVPEPVSLPKAPPPTEAPPLVKPEVPVIRTAIKTSTSAPRARDPKYESILNAGEDAYRHNQLLQANLFADKAIAIAPSVEAYLLLGKVLLYRDMPSEAAAAYRKALKLERGNAKAAEGLKVAQTAERAATAP